MTNSAYLLTSRKFPRDPNQLETELSKSYIDTANCVNAREIAKYSLSPTVTGQQWFYGSPNQKQQTLRQIYQFTAAGSIKHGITDLIGVTRMFGTYTDGSGNWYPLPYVGTAAGNLVSVYVTSTDIVITAVGAPPAISSGTIVLEWLAAA